MAPSRYAGEWREVVDVTADHAGTVSIRQGDDGLTTVVVTDSSGKAHPYALERDAQLGVADGAMVKPGQRLATERNRRYRLVEVEHATGREQREEVLASTGYWMQRGSESSRRGAIMEEAARMQLDARLAAQGVAKIPAGGGTEGYRRINHQRGGGGFDDVVVIFSGTPDEPKAFIRIREVKDYPHRHVPLEEFSAIRPPTLGVNIRVLSETAEQALLAVRRDKVPPPGFEGVTESQIRAIQVAIESSKMQIEIVLGPTTRIGQEHAPGASVLRTLRREIQAELNGADVLAGAAGGLDPNAERVDATYADAAGTPKTGEP